MKNTIGKMVDKKEAKDGAMTPFQAVCTALSAGDFMEHVVQNFYCQVPCLDW